MLCQISYNKFLTVRTPTHDSLPAFHLDEVVTDGPRQPDYINAVSMTNILSVKDGEHTSRRSEYRHLGRVNNGLLEQSQDGE